MVTIYDIAAKANVSAMTVSRVINNTGKISDKTRAKVRKVMEELNYVPNHNARSLVLQQTRSIFLLITDITNPFYTTLARGAEDAARKSGYRLLFGNSDENLAKEVDYIQTILTTRVDGVLIAPAGDPSLPHLDTLKKHNVPFVLLDREVPGIECDIVLGDSKDGARRLVEHLISQGHKRIALVNGSSSVSSARLRLQGYQEALKLGGVECRDEYLFEAGFGPSHDPHGIKCWFDGLSEQPTAIMAGNNVLALAIIRLLHERGLKVPDDLSVVCFDDLGPFAEIDPFLTVAAQQAYQFGYLGIQLLIGRLAERETASPWNKIVLPADLLIRRSVKRLTPAD
ncbi:LacI family DNA-binding transcriptional regulator [Paenibacillus tarimensis]|uniref:LacI family DNA-binding transcriptional regulator n=1 Tax=Paenibacillus tarimensis TaxID=416012 RepID=UPI001F40F3BE|nr:LacI family DNA-binding transcriptional regulator [Paenibacillus tarimensis]MCF2943092.1 LacI family transcriptional regulator [Paenibacillus tarimensis]